jgi:Family of unknown function (DUF6527)
MKAKPVKLVYGDGYFDCPIEEATHVELNFPGPVGKLHLPVILKGTRDGTNCWTWNGDVDKPTLRPSILTTGYTRNGGDKPVHCHTWVNDGQAQFLDDCTHELRGHTVDMLEVQP